MIPTVGRIVHVQQDPEVPCRAAIINAVDYGRGKPITITGTVFSPHWNTQPVSLITIDPEHWHDPRLCPAIVSVSRVREPSKGSESVSDDNMVVSPLREGTELLGSDEEWIEDEEFIESDSTPRFEGGYWFDPNDPTA